MGYTFAGLMMIVHGAAYRVFVPYVYESLRRTDESWETRRRLVRFTLIYGAALLLLALSLSAFASAVIPFLVGPGFESATAYVLWVALAMVSHSMYQMVAIYILYRNKTKLMTFTTDFLAAVINLPLTYFLVMRVGPLGAAQATFVAFTVTGVVTWIISVRVFPMPWFSAFLPMRAKEGGSREP